jgi:pimeloyl-ACP methyl ester carboxylesterase
MLRNKTQKQTEPIHGHERDVQARKGSLYIRDVREGEAVILLHGVPLNGRMWEPQMETLFGRYRLIAPDLARRSAGTDSLHVFVRKNPTP